MLPEKTLECCEQILIDDSDWSIEDKNTDWKAEGKSQTQHVSDGNKNFLGNG